VAVNNDRTEAVNDAKATVAFYAGLRQYLAMLENMGFGKEATICGDVFERHDMAAWVGAISDDMAETFVILGAADECRKRVEEVGVVMPRPAHRRPSAGESDGLHGQDRRHILLLTRPRLGSQRSEARDQRYPASIPSAKSFAGGAAGAHISQRRAHRMGAIARTARYGLAAAVRVLRHLIEGFQGSSDGRDFVCPSLGMDDDTSEPRRDIEPPSVRAGLIRHIPRGRAATRTPYLLFGMTVPPLINGLS
jgi:hypothetical protein